MSFPVLFSETLGVCNNLDQWIQGVAPVDVMRSDHRYKQYQPGDTLKLLSSHTLPLPQPELQPTAASYSNVAFTAQP